MKNIASENLSKLGKGLGESKLGKGLGDFKKFISRGNVVDMAVGVIIGAAFGKIVSSLVNDVLMPFVGIFMGGVDFSQLAITIGEAQIKYGAFIQTIIDFLVSPRSFEKNSLITLSLSFILHFSSKYLVICSSEKESLIFNFPLSLYKSTTYLLLKYELA